MLAHSIRSGACLISARASGVTRDLRKDEPYLAYADFDFNICCANNAEIVCGIA